MMLNKSLNKQSFIKECPNLFFLDGESQHGELKDMDFEITDFQLKPLEDEETTLGEIIDKAKFQFVHFYLRTGQKKNNHQMMKVWMEHKNKLTKPKSAHHQVRLDSSLKNQRIRQENPLKLSRRTKTTLPRALKTRQPNLFNILQT